MDEFVITMLIIIGLCLAPLIYRLYLACNPEKKKKAVAEVRRQRLREQAEYEHAHKYYEYSCIKLRRTKK